MTGMKSSVLLVGVLLLGLVEVGHAQATERAVATTVSIETSGAAPTALPEVLTYADEMPSFPGGDAAFHQFLVQKTTYPADAKRRNLSGTVVVRFVVDEQGRIRDAAVVKGCGDGFDEEALRLVRIMPWWNPGRMAGRPVWVARTMPLSFRLSH